MHVRGCSSAPLSACVCMRRQQQGPTKTLTVDRAWLESLLLDEMGSRCD
jgi:hypothetical protein